MEEKIDMNRYMVQKLTLGLLYIIIIINKTLWFIHAAIYICIYILYISYIIYVCKCVYA